MNIAIGLIAAIWQTFEESAPYILFGLFLSGLIQIFIDKERITKYLGQNNLLSVLRAGLVGVPLPLCSCGVIPAAMSLRKNGASKGATLSFLISTPETGVDSIAISYALLDPLMTVFRPLAAFITAITAGVAENFFDRKDRQAPPPAAVPKEEDHGSCCAPHEAQAPHTHSFKDKFACGMKFAFVDLLGDITKWFILGIIAAGLISYFVPTTWISEYVGEGLPAMLIMLAVGIPLYICASASTPIAAALILKGMSPGVALVFLLAGPATNAATIILVAKFLGKRAVVIYLLSIAICALGFGFLLNYLYAASGINVNATVGMAAHMCPHFLQTPAAIVLALLMFNSVRRPR